MSSSLYLGTPGAGKTFGVVRYVILPALDRGQRVVTNIPLNELALVDHLRKNLDGLIVLVDEDQIRAPNFWFTTEGLGETTTKGGDLIVIDECHAFYGSDQKIKSDHEVFRAVRLQRKFAGGSGNFSTNIVFVTQDFRDVTTSLRAVCDSMYFMQKLVVVGKPNTFRVDVYGDCRKSPERGTVVSTMRGEYDPVYYGLYNSYSTGVGGLSSDQAGVELVTDDRLNVWNNSVFSFGRFSLSLRHAKWAGIVGTVITLLLSGILFYNVLSRPSPTVTGKVPPAAVATEGVEAPPAASAASAPVKTSSLSKPAPERPSGLPDESTEFRLVGFYSLGVNKFAVIADRSGKYRYLQAGGFSETDFVLVQAGPATHIKLGGQVIAPWTGVPTPIPSEARGTSASKMETSR